MVAVRALLLLILLAPWGVPPPVGADVWEQKGGVFGHFSRHIQRQVESDKLAFAKASGCTNWFYHQQQRKPVRPDVQPIRFDLALQSPTQEECLRDYPGGLDAVRQDFHRTQTSLSVSLTFYEFALVGDRDDDARYSREELLDLFQSMDLPFDPVQLPTAHASALTERFDAWYRTRNLERLMNGMGQLYDKGYRVTPADRMELDRVTK